MSVREMTESFLAILNIRSHALYTHARQSFKFVMTGVLNATLDLGGLVLFIEVFHLPLRLSVFIASGIAVTNAFFMHKHWTFRNTTQRYAVQYMQFLLVYGLSFVLGIGITLFLAERVGLWYLFSRAVAIPICALWNYLWMHFGVFRRKSL